MLEQKSNNSKVRVEQVANIKPQTIKPGLDVHAGAIVTVRILDHSAPSGPLRRVRKNPLCLSLQS